MKKIISLAAITLLVVQLAACKKEEKAAIIKNDGLINFLAGNVSIVLGDNTIKANIGDKITQGMTIHTGSKSVVDIYFENSIIRILENSSVEVQELVKNLTDNKELTELYVKNGKMFAQITRKLIENEKFIIITPTSVAAVRGTEFLVSEENGKSKISCVSGTVAVRDASKENSDFVDVENGKSASIEPGKSVAVENLSDEDIKNIKKIKDDIKAMRADVKRKFEEQREAEKVYVEAIKDATKIQAEAIKGDVQEKDTSEPAGNFWKPHASEIDNYIILKKLQN